MRTYGSETPDNHEDTARDQTRLTGRHGAGNASSKRANRRHAKRVSVWC